MIDAAFADLVPLVCTRRACALVGKSHATHYRWLKPRRPASLASRPSPLNAFTPTERQAVLDSSPSDFADLPAWINQPTPEALIQMKR